MVSFNARLSHRWLAGIFLLFLATVNAQADFITPQMGGGSVGQTLAPMKHADIFYNPVEPGLLVGLDTSIAVPELRSLNAPDEFDATKPWSILTGKAYNYQYGWNVGASFQPDSGTWVWIEQTDASQGLEVYDRTPSSLDYSPIFGTDGSNTRWRWSGSMTHNVYAVENPTEADYFAEYKVYIGDNTTGEPIESYASSNVRFDFLFDLPLAGDYNQDGSVTTADYDTWVNQYGQAGNGLSADGNGDLAVDAADYSVWRNAMSYPTSTFATTVPEPSGLATHCLIFSSILSCLIPREAAVGENARIQATDSVRLEFDREF